MIDFFTNLPFLKQQSIIQIKKLSKFFVLRQCIINQVIFNQEDKPKYIYIVYDGNFELIRRKKRKANINDDIERKFIKSGNCPITSNRAGAYNLNKN
jgi:hypothetical protein